MKQPKVAVIVLTYNQEKETAGCLEGLKQLSYPAFETVVVDNGSRRSAEEALASRFPGVQWIRLPQNVGFAAGCNEGIRRALSRGVEGVLLLNNDAKGTSDLLDKMVETAFSGDAVGVVGAVIYRESPHRPLLAGMQFNFFTARIRRILPSSGRESMPVVSGSCFFIKKVCLEKVGFLDERFFIYFEETDFCYRARQKGYQVICDGRLSVQHEDGSTFGRGSAAFRYLYTRNRLLFLSKHCPRWLRPWSFFVRVLQDILLASFSLLQGHTEISRAISCGVEDYWKGRFQKGRLDSFFHD